MSILGDKWFTICKRCSVHFCSVNSRHTASVYFPTKTYVSSQKLTLQLNPLLQLAVAENVYIERAAVSMQTFARTRLYSGLL